MPNKSDFYIPENLSLGLIAAVADNGVIGKDNRLPWSIPDDMTWFMAHTLGRPIIMGKNTFLSIGRPLPDRENIVISRTLQPQDGIIVVPSLSAAIFAADAISLESWVIGGADLYARLLPVCTRFALTRVHMQPEGDTWFPEFDMSEWEELNHFESDDLNPDSTPMATFYNLMRRKPVDWSDHWPL